MSLQTFPGKGFGSFWMAGKLSPFEQACLSSFVIKGFNVTLFSYEAIENLPPGVQLADARSIVPKEITSRIIHAGRPDVTHFSDYFRYKMIQAFQLVWIDSDIVCLNAPFSGIEDRELVGQEQQGGMNNAILYLSSGRHLTYMIDQTEERFDKELRWGETGPKLLARALAKDDIKVGVHDYKIFYPIEHYNAWKLLLPEYRDWCVEKCKDAVTLHLYNNIIVRMGCWKSVAPPEGSYLNQCFKEVGGLKFFDRTYPEEVMAQMVENYLFAHTGGRLGIRSIMRQALPSLFRTLKHYYL